MMTQHRTIPGTVIEQVADREGVDPENLTPPLYHAIDPDALEKLVSGPTGQPVREDIRVEFTYCDYHITVDGTDVQLKDA